MQDIKAQLVHNCCVIHKRMRRSNVQRTPSHIQSAPTFASFAPLRAILFASTTSETSHA